MNLTTQFSCSSYLNWSLKENPQAFSSFKLVYRCRQNPPRKESFQHTTLFFLNFKDRCPEKIATRAYSEGGYVVTLGGRPPKAKLNIFMPLSVVLRLNAIVAPSILSLAPFVSKTLANF